MRIEDEEPVYVISIAAKLVEMHPQTLRLYERMGLVRPARTQRNIRLYSSRDVQRLQQIQRLTQDLGVNLAGVQVILDLLLKMEAMRQEMVAQMDRLHQELERARRDAQRQAES